MPKQQTAHGASPGASAQVTAAEISRIAGVTRATVSNWRRRHADFPEPDGGTESSPLYDLQAVQEWLRKRGQSSAGAPAEELRTALRLRPAGMASRLFPLVAALALDGERGEPELDSLSDTEVLVAAREAVDRLPAAVANLESIGSYETADAAAVRALARCVREVGAQAALDVLAERELEESAATGTYRTPDELASLMARLLPAGAHSALDPACGGGGLLVAAAQEGVRTLYGQDVLPVQAQRAAVRLLLPAGDARSGAARRGKAAKDPALAESVRIEAGDSLRADAFPGLLVDAVLCNPPFGDRDWGQEELAYDPRWAYGVPPRSESELAWVQHALAHVEPGGYAVLLLPPALAFRSSGRRIRTELARSGALRAVVSLPARAAQPFHVGLNIWVLQRPEPGGPERTSVLFVSGEVEAQGEGSGPGSRGARSRGGSAQPSVEWLDLTKRVLASWTSFVADPDAFTDEPGVARAVPVVDLLGDVVDFSPARHVRATAADVSPRALKRRVTELRGKLAEQVGALSAASESEAGEWEPADAVDGAAREGWRTATVSDLARGGALTLLRGAMPASRDTGSGSTAGQDKGSGAGAGTGADARVLTVGDLTAGTSPSGTPDRIRTDTAHRVAAGDVVLRGAAPQGTRGVMARVVGDEDAGAWLGPHLHILRPDPARLDAWFLAGFVGADDNIAVASTGTAGLTQINPGRLRIPLLPLAQQQRYGEAFRRVDELRAAARATAVTGEEMATAMVLGLTSGGLVPPEGP
ncbi:N-6 DNA methylase [Streptomyces cavernicola]|uniref:N-6 DNA methylase n=1 Tax=Streptomyces cavernicola TaxID=3043613 RepID=A0ABT6S2V6_9ACTN|nr:N-6 DNA methylase [Streptomyces sp. B-S-A6]MDI3402430.1 N-6 DNA methylase [Streptomyces sp. B-S-A6]